MVWFDLSGHVGKEKRESALSHTACTILLTIGLLLFGTATTLSRK